MIERRMQTVLLAMARQFKAVAVTGPRQSGKTTLVRDTFPEKAYVTLEAPDERARATGDPRRFLARFTDGCIFDEVQRVPELFSYLQEELDRCAEPGRYILTGSQQFGMMEKITQSLAGRIAILNLLPFSLVELASAERVPATVDRLLWQGSYPPIHDPGIDPVAWLDAYITTYVERDVRQIVNVQDTMLFQRFVSLCAGNVGQLFNASRIGNDCGVNHGTVSKWLSILEASWIAFRLPPHHRNFRKRVVKTPKVYFWDVGLACRLLGIEAPEQLATHPLRGHLFENWALTELLKGRFNRRLRSNLFFWRNNTGMEVDVIAEQAGRLVPIEIKSGATVGSDWFASLEKWMDLAGDDAGDPSIVYGGDVAWREGRVGVIPWRDIGALAEQL